MSKPSLTVTPDVFWVPVLGFTSGVSIAEGGRLFRRQTPEEYMDVDVVSSCRVTDVHALASEVAWASGSVHIVVGWAFALIIPANPLEEDVVVEALRRAVEDPSLLPLLVRQRSW